MFFCLYKVSHVWTASFSIYWSFHGQTTGTIITIIDKLANLKDVIVKQKQSSKF